MPYWLEEFAEIVWRSKKIHALFVFTLATYLFLVFKSDSYYEDAVKVAKSKPTRSAIYYVAAKRYHKASGYVLFLGLGAMIVLFRRERKKYW